MVPLLLAACCLLFDVGRSGVWSLGMNVIMASLLNPTATTTTTLKRNQISICFSPLKAKSAIPNHVVSFSARTNRFKCNAFLEGLLEKSSEISLQSGMLLQQQFERASEELSDMQRLGFVVFGGLTWVYLTARPGVLIGAIDAYLLAPLQLGLDNLFGRRKNLKRSDFLVGDKLGEGSFGVVYSGVLVPKNVNVDDRKGRRGKALTKLDAKSKDKVILKKVPLN